MEEEKSYSLVELQGVASMLADTLKMDHGLGMASLQDMQKAHPWLCQLVTIFENKHNWTEMLQCGGTTVRVAGGTVCSRKTAGESNHSAFPLRPHILRVSLPDACIWDNLEPRWGAGVPSRFQFLQFAPDHYRFIFAGTPEQDWHRASELAEDSDGHSIFDTPEQW